MEKYLVRDLKFMKVKEKNDNYYYLGIYNSDVSRVYIPTLNDSFAYSEIVFGSDLISEYVERIPGFSKKSSYELDDFGYLQSGGIATLNESEIRKVEKYRNKQESTIKSTPDVDPRFFKKRRR